VLTISTVAAQGDDPSEPPAVPDRGLQASEGDVVAILPALPNLDHLRRQAKDLLRAAQRGDSAAAAQITSVSPRLILSGAQLVVARSYGFASWPRLRAEVAARSAALDQLAAAFSVASVADRTGRAARMLAETPELATWNLATALLLGDVASARVALERDPATAVRPDPATGWTPLHAVCASRWHRLDPDRAAGLVATARLLLDAGADPNARIGPDGRSAGSSPLRCAAGSASQGLGNAAIVRLLLERGAVVEDDDLYLASFGGDDHLCLRLMLDHAGAAAAEIALSAPLSNGGEVLATRMLLEAGADPRRFALEPGQPSSAVYFAVESGCSAELITLLIDYGADPRLPGPDGGSPSWLAAIKGRDDILDILGDRDGEGVPDTGRFVAACMRADRAAAGKMTTADPGLLGRLADAELAALVHAAETGRIAAVELMLDLGFPVGARRDDGATALHAAAYAGSAPVARLLISAGADLEALDGQFDSPPLDWAVVGSGYRPATAPKPDWVATVQALIEAGASTQEISFAADNAKPPSAEVAEFLRAHGVGADTAVS
jgi:ankyrin repeat protein